MAKRKNKNFISKFSPIIIPVIIAALAIIGMFFVKKAGIFSKGKETIVTSSTLMDAIDISDLSAAKYTYNGIAKIYKDDGKTVKCNIRYHSTVKAGIDFSEVEFEVDKENLIVTAKLPEIKITANLVDEEALEFLPENTDIDLKEARETCKKDAEEETLQSTALYEVAKDNLKKTIESLTHPLLENNGYTLEWSE